MMKPTIVLNKHVDSAECSLSSIVLGVTMKKISLNNNIFQYLQISPSTQ